MNSMFRATAGMLARSPLLLRGKLLYQKNTNNFNLPMSKLDKLVCGVYVILTDYYKGVFPPTFNDQAMAYQAEMTYGESLPGISHYEYVCAEMCKPFWNAKMFRRYVHNFERLFSILEQNNVNAGSRLLELGCGGGWMAEFFALAKYNVVATTISPLDVQLANQRIEALKQKKLDIELSFHQKPMESVDELFNGSKTFDAAYVFEALHHAYDWRKALQSTARCLKPGGILIIANEPNILHTFISYRVAKLAKTHEIGLSKEQMLHHLATCGFSHIKVIKPRFNNWISPHWIVARR